MFEYIYEYDYKELRDNYLHFPKIYNKTKRTNLILSEIFFFISLILFLSFILISVFVGWKIFGIIGTILVWIGGTILLIFGILQLLAHQQIVKSMKEADLGNEKKSLKHFKNFMKLTLNFASLKKVEKNK
ncbi:hypothetical protein [Mycoplasmopsis lipofaciens]|uniref:hypothetical protein n=1 Tax=Mycoplasmopsis lipofaciens TaxID=114884 RepID=UPI00048392EE|nr:hypothetical protein [Mycoplasmopsis lipofaciens]